MRAESETIGLPSEALELVSDHTALAALCPLIPVPFVDEAIIDHVRQRMLQKLWGRYNLPLSAPDAQFLTAPKSKVLAKALLKLVIWPIKKILHKLIFVLAIKRCADVATLVFHEGWLMARTLEERYIPHEELALGDRETLERLRDAIVSAHDQVNPDATNQTMRSALGVGREVMMPLVQSLWGIFRFGGEDEKQIDRAEVEAEPIGRRIETELERHWELAPELDAALRRELGNAAAGQS